MQIIRYLPLVFICSVVHAMPKTIYIIRHAEKIFIPDSVYNTISLDKLITIEHMLPLSVKGHERAQALGILFSQRKLAVKRWLSSAQKGALEKYLDSKKLDKAVGLNNLIQAPDYIFVRGSTKKNHYVRTKQTMIPLAQQLKAPINDHYTAGPTKLLGVNVSPKIFMPLVNALKDKKYDNKVLLLCWEHHSIAPIAKLLGAPKAVINKLKGWPHKSFDQIWAFNYKSNYLQEVIFIPQKLMFGDTDVPIKRYPVTN